MKCKRCGHENEPGFQFCENCGIKLEQTTDQTAKDELHVPSIFEEPVAYTGKYSEEPKPRKRRSWTMPAIVLSRKLIGVVASLLLLVMIWAFASQYGRSDDEIPPVIGEYEAAVRAEDVEKLQQILVSTTTLAQPNPKSYGGFFRVMEIPGRLQESVRNLEVDLSHLMQNDDYVSNLPVKLLRLEEDGEPVYRIGVETFDVKVGDTGALIDGEAPDENGVFTDYLMGQYTLTYDINRYPLQLDSTNPQLADGMIIPVQLADRVTREDPVTEGPDGQTETQTEAAGTLRVQVISDAQNGRARINGEDTEQETGSGPISINPGEKLQIVDLWPGGIGLSEEITVRESGTVDLPINYDTQDFRDMIFQQIRAMLIEDAQMLNERNAEDFSTVTGPALEAAVDNVDKLIRGNQYYAGTYDRIAFDLESFTLERSGNEAEVHVLGLMTYVYQTYTVGTPQPNIDNLWRDDVVMSFDLILDQDTGQWLVSDWGRTGESMTGGATQTVDIIQ